MSKEMNMPSRRKAFWPVAAILFAVALHPVRANAQGGARTDSQIVGIVFAADEIDIDTGNWRCQKRRTRGSKISRADDHRSLVRFENRE